MDMGSGRGSGQLALAELALFWATTVVHLLRLLSPRRLPDADRPVDVGHVIMGTGMTLMVFPGVSVAALHVAAAVYVVLAVAYLARAVRRRSPTPHHYQDAAIGAGQAAMAYMLAGPTHPPSWVPLSVAGVLTGCTLVHGWRLLDEHHRHGGIEGTPRMLVTVPHIGALVMTLAMALMVGNV
jgi:hypothetical protein